MDMNDLVIISVDDHISEPPGLFDNHLSGADLASAPKLISDKNGKDLWVYQGLKFPSVGLNAVVGRPFDEYGMEPTSLSQLRPGVYDVHARIGDMDVNGIAASLNFGSVFDFAGGRLHKVPDKALALKHLAAYNDWHIDEWCGAYPGRFIPCAILPTWDIPATIAEMKRIVAKGCTTVSINENPTVQGMPSIHNEYWAPFYKAVAELDITICLHIGGGNPAPHASMETPIEAWISTMPMSIAHGAADWLQLRALQQYPNMRIALSEGSIGWVPYFLERTDFSNDRHKAWTNSQFPGPDKPSDTFRKHFLNCFIDDAFGLQNLQYIGEDMVAYECDYPHSDTLWPEVPERLWPTIRHLAPAQIAKITHGNAMRFFKFDPFAHYAREELTVAALRARAKAAGVDTTPKSSGGDPAGGRRGEAPGHFGRSDEDVRSPRAGKRLSGKRWCSDKAAPECRSGSVGQLVQTQRSGCFDQAMGDRIAQAGQQAFGFDAAFRTVQEPDRERMLGGLAGQQHRHHLRAQAVAGRTFDQTGVARAIDPRAELGEHRPARFGRFGDQAADDPVAARLCLGAQNQPANGGIA